MRRLTPETDGRWRLICAILACFVVASLAAIPADASATDSLAARRMPSVELLVKLNDVNAGSALARDRLAAHVAADARDGLRSRELLSSGASLSLFSYDTRASAAAALRELRVNPNVATVEPNVKRRLAWDPGDEGLADQSWWLDQIDAPEAWDVTTGVESVVVAVVDSGVSPTHPDLADRLVPGYNAVDGSSDTADIDGHGTHVAGIIAAQGQNVVGTAGVAMDTRIMPIRVVDDAGEIDVADEIEAIYWAVDNGADIINLSLGSDEYVQTKREAIQYARDAGVIVVAAAGNEFNAISYPANYEETISAGAMNADGLPSSFTSRLTRVDIGAPGENIYSPGWDAFFGDYWDDVFYSDYSAVSGTSFSAAIVSGTAALVRSVGQGFTVEEVRSLLTATATDSGNPGPESGTGAGRVNVEAAVREALRVAVANRWREADSPVASGAVSRTWLWGVGPTTHTYEAYDETPHGVRLVYYYDKSRLEVTDPHGDRNDPWYVTNGLLVQELISGALQLGDNRFETRESAAVNVAGDPDDPFGPTYASFTALLDMPAIRENDVIVLTIDRDGRVNADSRFTAHGVYGAEYVPETRHRVASVFWDYLNSAGTIATADGFEIGPLFEPWFYATGYPITEPYWASVKLAGVYTDVLVQCFERRCLTFTPSNAPGWQVEMGNVGQHYYAWRYASATSVPEPDDRALARSQSNTARDRGRLIP